MIKATVLDLFGRKKMGIELNKRDRFLLLILREWMASGEMEINAQQFLEDMEEDGRLVFIPRAVSTTGESIGYDIEIGYVGMEEIKEFEEVLKRSALEWRAS
jgi:hypothetical protein